MVARRQTGADLNGIFVVISYLLYCGTLLFYYRVDFPELVNGTTLALYSLLLIQVRWLLFLEKRRRSPFILVLVFVLTFFHFSRIATLYWFRPDQTSAVLNRLRPATVSDINYTLLFILVANLAIALGIAVAQQTASRRVAPAPTQEQRGASGARVFWLSASTAYYTFYTGFIVPLTVAGVEQRWLRYLGFVLSRAFFLPVAIVYLHQARRVIGGRLSWGSRSVYVVAIAVITGLLVVMQMALGSRSSILGLAETVLFVFLATGKFRIATKWLVSGVLLLAVSVPLYTVSSLSRTIKAQQGTDVQLRVQSSSLWEEAAAVFANADVLQLLQPVFERTAFLDYSVDLIKNSAEYGQVIDVPFYAMSLVDNFTPGFDVFDVPKASNALVYIYSGTSAAMQRQTDAYQSDQFNVYGEYYVLGGWLSLPAFACAAFLFQWAYLRVRARSTFATVMWRYFVISLFFNWLISFGADWLIIAGVMDALLYALVLPVLDLKLLWSFPARRLREQTVSVTTV